MLTTKRVGRQIIEQGANEIVNEVQQIDNIVNSFFMRDQPSDLMLFGKYLYVHLVPSIAPDKVKTAYMIFVYLFLFYAVYFSLVTIDQTHTSKIWLRYILDCVGMVSILCFIHCNYLNNNNGLYIIGHSIIYSIALFMWILFQPRTLFEPVLLDAEGHLLSGQSAMSFSGLVIGDAQLQQEDAQQFSEVDAISLHVFKAVTLLIVLTLVEWLLVSLGVVATKLAHIYRVWINTGTGNFVVHDLHGGRTMNAAQPVTNNNNNNIVQ